MMVDTWLTTLSVFPARSIIDAVNRFLTGRVDGHNRAFMPKLPEVYAEAERITRSDPLEIGLRHDFRNQLRLRVQRGTDAEFEAYSMRVVTAKPCEDVLGLVEIADELRFHVPAEIRALVEGDRQKRIAAE